MTKFSHPEYDKDEKSIGDGDEVCRFCKGRGVVYLVGSSPPKSVRCKCSVEKDLIYNMENGWPGLSRVPLIDDSVLLKYVESNMWITSSLPEFRNHMRFVATKMGHKFIFKVSSDSDLVNIWLSRLSDVKDPDYSTPPEEDNNLNRFVSFPSLLVIQLGVKVASNRETPSVVQETVSLRYHLDKPTWIIDQPYNRLQDGHKAYSRQLIDHLQIYNYKKTQLDSEPEVKGFSTGYSEEPIGTPKKQQETPFISYDNLLDKKPTRSLMDNAPKKKKFNGF